MFWLPFFLSKYCGFSPPAAASVATAFDVGGAAGNLAAGVLCDRLYGGRMMLASLHLSFATAAGFLAWAVLCAASVEGSPPVLLHVAVHPLPPSPTSLASPPADRFLAWALGHHVYWVLHRRARWHPWGRRVASFGGLRSQALVQAAPLSHSPRSFMAHGAPSLLHAVLRTPPRPAGTPAIAHSTPPSLGWSTVAVQSEHCCRVWSLRSLSRWSDGPVCSWPWPPQRSPPVWCCSLLSLSSGRRCVARRRAATESAFAG